MSTMPIVLAGAMTVSMNLDRARRDRDPRTQKRPSRPKCELSPTARAAQTAAPAVRRRGRRPPHAPRCPRRYTVKAGDTVSAIAARFGLSTASVLAAQRPRLEVADLPRAGAQARPAPRRSAPPSAAPPTTYTIKRGDTISGIAARYGLTTQAPADAQQAAAGRASSTPARPSGSSGSSIAITPVSERRRPTDPPSPPPTSAPAPDHQQQLHDPVRRHGHVDRRAVRRQRRRRPGRERAQPREHHLRGAHPDDPGRRQRPGRIDASPR